ncbi:hypothetical protein TWF694_010581 [Orbilia ellipsospora]|uniref:Uncharacterized protein n=1 Tax=Orbilia ellipsospora TaxID=2528407 RepID=A0AAV9XAB4_9PEZI
MDYLLACENPSQVCYISYLQAYANGCHILNLPFVERIAKVDFECMIRKRFFDITDEEEELDIIAAVLEAAYIPLMPAWFFEQTPVTQDAYVRNRSHVRSASLQASIPTASAKVIDQPATNPSRRATIRRRSTCSRTAFSASYQYATSICTSEDDAPVAAAGTYIPKSILLQIVSHQRNIYFSPCVEVEILR